MAEARLRIGTGLPGPGRPKGSETKANAQVRTMFRQFVENNAGNVQTIFDKVAAKSPARALRLLADFSQFFLPKLAHIDADIFAHRDIDGLSDDELAQLAAHALPAPVIAPPPRAARTATAADFGLAPAVPVAEPTPTAPVELHDVPNAPAPDPTESIPERDSPADTAEAETNNYIAALTAGGLAFDLMLRRRSGAP